nr:uncharacterized protein LOC117217549 [Megalopta genalis]
MIGRMSALPLLRKIHQSMGSIGPQVLSASPTIATRTMHYMNVKQSTSILTNIFSNKINSGSLLLPFVPIYNITCGLKMKTILHRRCRKCYEVWKNDRKYIICKEHPRHNQVERKPQPYKLWKLSSVSQKPKRDW